MRLARCARCSRWTSSSRPPTRASRSPPRCSSSTDAARGPVLLVPAVIVFVAYRAYISERQRHEKLEFLYEANRALTRSPEVARAIEGVLARSLEAFRSEMAEIVLFSADGTPLRTTLRARRRRRDGRADRRARAEELARADRRRPPAVVSLEPPYGSERLRALPRAARIRHAMVAMLPGENRVIGTIMLANRFGVERGPTATRTCGCSRCSPTTPASRCSTTGSSRRCPSCASCRSSCTTRPTTTR